MKEVLEIPFFSFGNIVIEFIEKKLVQRTYIVIEALFTTIKIEVIDKKDFPQAAIDKNIETFIVYVSSIRLGSMTIHLILKAQITCLFTKEVTETTKYTDFANIFSKQLAKVFSERKGINEHAIKLLDSK